MAILVPDASEILMVKNILNHTAPQNQTLKLFANNYTPVAASVAGDFTEAAGGGYAAKSLTGSSWTVTTNASDEAEGVYAAQTFTFTGELTTNPTIYGYYIIQATSGLLLWAQRFPDTRTPSQNGDSITFIPRFQLFSEN